MDEDRIGRITRDETLKHLGYPAGLEFEAPCDAGGVKAEDALTAGERDPRYLRL